jgi:DNA-binding XRE family transcriptional regulator
MAVKTKIKNHQKLAELIYRNGYSVQSFARETGLSDTTIQTLIDGTRDSCNPTTSEKILKHLNLKAQNPIEFDDIFFITYSCKSKNLVVREEAATLEPTGTEGR